VQLNYILARIQASKISSWCVNVGSDAFGGAYIYNGSVAQDGSDVYNPSQTPGRNTVVPIDGATITFNSQTVVGGRLYVAAIKVVSGPEVLYLGTSACHPDDD
jgi:hypothetical protein